MHKVLAAADADVPRFSESALVGDTFDTDSRPRLVRVWWLTGLECASSRREVVVPEATTEEIHLPKPKTLNPKRSFSVVKA